ncbi:hypothetical protein TNCV_3983391 [Trichonephila clavipes]|nr:hypothetical protein TNCV_3983391 [Trichonephila clavipes]
MHVHTATDTTIDNVPGSGGKLTPNRKMGKLTSLRSGRLFHIFNRYDASHLVFPLPFLPPFTFFLPWRRFRDGFAGSHVRCLYRHDARCSGDSYNNSRTSIQLPFIDPLPPQRNNQLTKQLQKSPPSLMFTRRPRLPVGLTPVKFFGQPVPWVRVAKYLGLFLDAKLTFAHHIEQTRKKAQAVHAVLKRLISRRSKLAIRHKVLLYKSIIRPVMSYGSQIWGSAGMCH